MPLHKEPLPNTRRMVRDGQPMIVTDRLNRGGVLTPPHKPPPTSRHASSFHDMSHCTVHTPVSYRTCMNRPCQCTNKLLTSGVPTATVALCSFGGSLPATKPSVCSMDTQSSGCAGYEQCRRSNR